METEYSKYEPIFGSWKIKEIIGEGSFGKVFRIEREDFGRTYKAALKAITIPKNENDIRNVMSEGMDEESASTYFREFVEEMTEEFAIMDKLKGNTNIVSYEDHEVIPHEGKIGWDILIRMELLTPLTEYLQNHSFSEKDVIKLGIDLCNALELCEKFNVIHRDIKPDNIFVSELGSFKLGDFGIARVAEKTTGASTKVGTNSYMAPEVMRGTKYDASVDIYSLGLVLYRLLNNNRLPFLPPAPAPITFSQREAAQAKRMSGVAVPPPVNGNEALKNAVLKAVSFEPSERFSNAASMRAALEEAGNIGVSFDELRESSQKTNIISYDDTEYFNTQVDKTVVEAPTVTASELETEMHNGQTNEKTGGGKKKIVGLIGIIAAAVIGFIIIAVIFFNGSRTESTYTPVAETETESTYTSVAETERDSSDASANNDESSEKKLKESEDHKSLNNSEDDDGGSTGYAEKMKDIFPKENYSYDGNILKYEDTDYYSRFGIDVSFYQGDIDWVKVGNSGVKFTFIRLGSRKNGSCMLDDKFEENIKGAQAAGIDIGLYFYSQAQNENEIEEDAEFVLAQIDEKINCTGYSFQLPVVIELDPNLVENGHLVESVNSFCKKINDAGYEPMVYIHSDYLDKFQSDSMSILYPVWYGYYAQYPEMPRKYRFLQYYNKGSIPGIDGYVDLDIEMKEK